MKKKYLALVLAACMTASLAACGSTADTSAPAATTEEAADTAAAESTEAADTAAATGEHGPSSEAAPAWEDYDARIAAIRSETDLVKREALMQPIQDEIYEAVKEISTQKGYAVVVDRASASSIIFASPSIDISNEVLVKLGYSN